MARISHLEPGVRIGFRNILKYSELLHLELKLLTVKEKILPFNSETLVSESSI